MLEITVALVVGALIGAFVTGIAYDAQAGFGTLHIDHSNPEKDVYRLEIDKFDDISKKKRVTLHINHNANLSQN